jgi:heat shock protein HslJ
LAGALLVAATSGCAERTTTGVQADEELESETVSVAEEGGHSTPANELSGTAWILTGSTLTGKGADQAEITAEFSDEQMSGQAPVNRYMAAYEVQGEAIEFGTIAATLMAGPEAQMELETEFFELLESVDSYTLAEDALILRAEDAEVLEFEATAAEAHSE